MNLLIASYLFYAAWNPPFVVLLWISTLVDWIAAANIHSHKRRSVKRSFLLLSLFTNLGLLSFFKYSGFIVDNFVNLLSFFNVTYQPALPSIILPMGISFYTFQTLSYTLDVYKGRTEPSDSFLDYALYVTFFPQLVAGPIVRATHFLPQCKWPKKPDADNIGWGASLLLLGLFEKIVIADGVLAPIADKIYESRVIPDTICAWAGTLAFSGQIFCDFAGYSTCAIGVALCLGFEIPDNFKYPYAATGFSDFWRRWHISLSSWLKDYLYISLGGNRKGKARTYCNLMITMLLGGLWHGASWTFVVWGALHGLFLVLERFVKKLIPSSTEWNQSPVKILMALFTFLLVSMTWVFFRAHDFNQAFTIINSMLGTGGVKVLNTLDTSISLITISSMLFFHWIMRDRSLKELSVTVHWVFRSGVYAALLSAILFLSGDSNAFIYFQF